MSGVLQGRDPFRAPARGDAAGADPLLVLAAPRSFSSVVASMLGQHPEMFGVPEMQLFGVRTVGDWLERCKTATFPMGDGLLRAVAELLFGEQTERTVVLARRWLEARADWPTPALFRLLAGRVAPRIVVEKSPSIVYDVRSMRRADRAFPGARFLHLVRNPLAHGQSVLKHIEESRRHGAAPGWLLELAAYQPPAAGGRWLPDPQRSWLRLNANVVSFLGDLPDDRKLRIRGEDALVSPDATVTRIADWLGLRTDADAVDAMLHPERSPFARYGPPNAQYGNDIFFLKMPRLRPARVEQHRLDEPVPWRADGTRLLPEVVHLARSFGYE